MKLERDRQGEQLIPAHNENTPVTQVDQINNLLISRETEARKKAGEALATLEEKMAILDVRQFINDIGQRINKTPTIRVAHIGRKFSSRAEFEKQMGPERVYEMDDEELNAKLVQDFQYAAEELGKRYFLARFGDFDEESLGICIKLPLFEDDSYIECYIAINDKWTYKYDRDVLIVRAENGEEQEILVQDTICLKSNYKLLKQLNKSENEGQPRGRRFGFWRKSKDKSKRYGLLVQTRNELKKGFVDSLSYETRKALISQIDQAS